MPITLASSSSSYQCRTDYSSQNDNFQVANVQEPTILPFVPSTSASTHASAKPSDGAVLCPRPPHRELYPQSAVGSETSRHSQQSGSSSGRLQAINGTLHVDGNSNTASNHIISDDDARAESTRQRLYSEAEITASSFQNNSKSSKVHDSASRTAVVHDEATIPGTGMRHTSQQAKNGKQLDADRFKQISLPSRPKRKMTAQIMDLFKSTKPEVAEDLDNEHLAEQVKLIIDQDTEDSGIDVITTVPKENVPGEDSKGGRRFICSICSSKWHCHSDLK